MFYTDHRQSKLIDFTGSKLCSFDSYSGIGYAMEDAPNWCCLTLIIFFFQFTSSLWIHKIQVQDKRDDNIQQQ